jgi:hypothetical protein
VVIVMLTARDEEVDVVVGLETGADDLSNQVDLRPPMGSRAAEPFEHKALADGRW